MSKNIYKSLDCSNNGRKRLQYGSMIRSTNSQDFVEIPNSNRGKSEPKDANHASKSDQNPTLDSKKENQTKMENQSCTVVNLQNNHTISEEGEMTTSVMEP